VDKETAEFILVATTIIAMGLFSYSYIEDERSWFYTIAGWYAAITVIAAIVIAWATLVLN
jgi:type IV secretory pathway component VirB8